MALDPTRLAQAVVNSLKTLNPKIGATEEAELLDIWNPICADFVTEYTANAVITTAGTATAVQTGGSTAPTTSTGTMT